MGSVFYWAGGGGGGGGGGVQQVCAGDGPALSVLCRMTTVGNLDVPDSNEIKHKVVQYAFLLRKHCFLPGLVVPGSIGIKQGLQPKLLTLAMLEGCVWSQSLIGHRGVNLVPDSIRIQHGYSICLTNCFVPSWCMHNARTQWSNRKHKPSRWARSIALGIKGVTGCKS